MFPGQGHFVKGKAGPAGPGAVRPACRRLRPSTLNVITLARTNRQISGGRQSYYAPKFLRAKVFTRQGFYAPNVLAGMCVLPQVLKGSGYFLCAKVFTRQGFYA